MKRSSSAGPRHFVVVHPAGHLMKFPLVEPAVKRSELAGQAKNGCILLITDTC
jgi:hypothetical protein